jgi:hypothetical protein
MATLANSVLVLLLSVSEDTQRAPHWMCLCLSFWLRNMVQIGKFSYLCQIKKRVQAQK